MTATAGVTATPGGSANTRPASKRKAMDEAVTELAELDDFEVMAERARVADLLAALTDRYRQLNHEMNRRETLRWMVP
jgi:hypothetical protein